jgi:hypothetical protein
VLPRLSIWSGARHGGGEGYQQVTATIPASGRARTAIAAAIAAAYVGIALLHGGYATTTIAWGVIGVWAVVSAGLVLRLWRFADVPRAGLIAASSFAGLAVLSVVSLAWADDQGRAFVASLLPGLYAGILALVLLTVRSVATRTWLVGLACGATAVGVIGLASRLAPGVIDAPSLAHSLGAGRLSYPIGYWNGLASCLAAGLVLLVWLGSQGGSRLVRSVSVGLLPLGGLAMFFTSSRGGVVATVIGIAVLVGLGPNRARLSIGATLGALATVGLCLLARGRYDLIHDLRGAAHETQGLEVAAIALCLCGAVALIRWWLDGWLGGLRVPRRVRAGVLVALLATGLVVIAAADPGARFREFENDSPAGTAIPGQRDLVGASGTGRAQFWSVALDAFGSHPLGGVGAGNYELYWNAHPKAAIVTGNAHSFFLEELADLGPLGLALALGPFVAAIAAARRRWSLPDVAPALALLATASLGALIDWTWRIPAAFLAVLVAIGLLAGGARAPDRDASSAPRRDRFGVSVAAILFAWVIVWVAGVVVLSSWHLAESREAVARGDLSAAASDARAAGSIEPFSPEPPIQLALVYALAGENGRARAAAGDAIDLAAGDWRGWQIASEIDLRRGAALAAVKERARATELAPVPLPPGILPSEG